MRARISRVTVALLLLFGIEAGHAQQRPPIELGMIPHLDTDAAGQCIADIVVWADSDTGYFYPKSRPEYGHGTAGTFTCMKAAMTADYWNINPFSNLGGGKAGREFPIDPTLLDRGS